MLSILNTGLRFWGKRQSRTIQHALCLLLLAIPAMSSAQNGYKILPAIQMNNLAIFPVVSTHPNDTSGLMTFDEGVRSGQVVVTEVGMNAGMIHPGQNSSQSQRYDGARVNNLVLYNNSSRPLLLLAGEIVTGGKQDRVVGSDRIVPPHAGPIDLGVFCVEHERWVQTSAKFSSMGSQMAQPSIRMPAMAERDQQKVWDNVRTSNANMARNLSGSAKAEVANTSSYAKAFDSAPVTAAITKKYGGEKNREDVMRELRSKGAVGVVIAVNGRVVWADIFADTELLAKYWPKLMQSYIAEAMTSSDNGAAADIHEAELFISNLKGNREVAETEPGVYRRTDITGDGYRVFELQSLLPKMNFDVHITKIRK